MYLNRGENEPIGKWNWERRGWPGIVIRGYGKCAERLMQLGSRSKGVLRDPQWIFEYFSHIRYNRIRLSTQDGGNVGI